VCVYVHQHSHNALCMPFSFQLSNVRCYRENDFDREIFPNSVPFDVSNAAKNGVILLSSQNTLSSLL
jgi:hypothetical protein